jgi:hypothetical protein
MGTPTEHPGERRPVRPSDAIAEAFGLAMKDTRHWPGRMGTFQVRLLIALRELGWDVVPKQKAPNGGSGGLGDTAKPGEAE